MKQPLYKQIAGSLQAYRNCIVSDNIEWRDKHNERIESLVKDNMPSGSGIDSGVDFDLEKSTPAKLIFTFGYHHMAESGMYDGWTQHKLTVTPSLVFDFEMKITGENPDGIKDYFCDIFSEALNTIVE